MKLLNMIVKLSALLLFSSLIGAAQSAPGDAGQSAPAGFGVGQSTSGVGQSTSGANRPTIATPSAPATPGNREEATPGKTATSKEAEPAESEKSPATPMPQSEFQIFAEEAAGRALPVYGRQLFDQVPSTFSPLDQVPVPANYVLGPGDGLTIRAWGKIDVDAEVTVDRDGMIFLPKVGTVRIAGLRFDQVYGFLKSAIGNLYKDFELSVSMGPLRSIQIYVLGSARKPGVYTVGSLSTLVDALFATGGPSATGSMRHFQLRRDGKLVTEFDIYDLLRKGDKSKDVQLLPGDVIYIPTIGPQIALVGSVNEPGIFELKDELTLAQVLADAGGLTNLAGNGRVLVERIENHTRRRVDELTMDAGGLQYPLADGDLIRISSISPQFDNAVVLRGNVSQGGRYLWHEGMRVRDLIPSREFLISGNYWRQQNLLGGEAGASTQHADLISEIVGANTEINWDYAAIERLDKRDLTAQVVPFNLAKAIDDPASPENQLLQPGDVVAIFSRSDLPVAQEKHASFVHIGGEVNAPGLYRIGPGETLQSLIERAGGFTARAYIYGTQFTRGSVREQQEQELQISIARMQKELLARYMSSPTITTPYNTAQNQEQQLSVEEATIAQIANIHPTGRIVLGIAPHASSVNDLPAVPLEDGDGVYIPAALTTVQVAGSVFNASGFRFEAGKRLSAYLRDAGGPTREADTKRIFLVRADGRVINNHDSGRFWRGGFDNLTLFPGDAIVVPMKLKSVSGFANQIPLVSQILSESALTGAVVHMAY